MAIAVDSSVMSSSQSSSPITWNHTVTNSGANTFLVVGVATGGNNVTQATTTAVAYKGVAMTKATVVERTLASLVKSEVSIWMLANPSTGTNQVSASITGIADAVGNSVSYTGANQTNTADATSSIVGSSTGSQSFTVTTVASNCWIYALGMNAAVSGPTLTANQTARGSQTMATAAPTIATGEDTNAAVASGANTMGFTVGAGNTEDGWLFAGASFAPTSGGVTIVSPLSILGAG